MGRDHHEHGRIRRRRTARQRTARRRTAVVPGVLLAALALLSVACGQTDDTQEARANGDTSTTPSTAPSTSTTSTTVPELKGASITTESVPARGTETAQLLAVRIGAHAGYDRVVFELSGELPGYDIGYLDGPAYEDGSGDEVEVDGEHLLSVRLTPTSGVIIGVDEVEQTYLGPNRITGDGQPVVEVVQAGDFEAQSTWVIGVDGERPFKVSTLDSPTRIIVDVADA